MDPSVVVWWTIDSLRRDACSLYGGEAATPTLERLAEDGRAFEGRSEATWTLPSVTSILTGEPPASHGVTDDEDRLEPGFATLPQFFRHAGWRTVGLIANPWFTRRKGLDIGFDRFYNITEDGSLLTEVSPRDLLNYAVRIRSLNGGLTLDRDRHPSEPLMAAVAADRVRSTPRPTFLMVHTQGVHSPYHPPSGWRRHSNGRDSRHAAYMNLVEYVDDQLGRFLRRLDENPLVVVTSDHGESLGESGKWGHRARGLELLYDVPLVINRPNEAFTDPVSHLDVHRWLRDEIAPMADSAGLDERMREQLEALGYVDGEHEA